MRTFRTIGVVGSVAALLLSATVAFAEEQSLDAANRPVTASTTRGDIKGDVPDAARERMEAARKEAKERMEAAREDAKERMKIQREEAKERMEAAREDAKERLETARADAQERMKEKREKAVKRLADIQDKMKQQLAERLTKQFDSLNSKWTDHFMQQLDRYDAIVQKIQDRTSIALTNGKDITATNVALEAAKVAIVSARTAVTAQAAKTYTLDTTTIIATTATTTPSGQSEIMQGLRTLFKNLHATLFRDLFALRDGPMMSARRAVQNAHQTLSKIPGVDNDDDDDDDESATSTAKKSNQ